MTPQIEAFFDDATCTVSYVVFDQSGGHCALIDAVLDYDPRSGRTSTLSAQRLIDFVKVEIGAHAGHLVKVAGIERDDRLLERIGALGGGCHRQQGKKNGGD